MLRGFLVLLLAAILALFAAPSVRQGIKDLTSSTTHLKYYPIRDMRRSVALAPQKVVNRLPSEESVPTTGKDVILDRDIAAVKLHNPIPSDDASIARGDSLFHTFCTPCHGKSMAGDGPVAAQFMPPPDLMAQQTRDRKDGYIYSYIRHGGVVMPSYGFQVSAVDAWCLVNFIRHQQKVSPR